MKKLFAICLMLFGMAATCLGQQASIVGTVTDTTGAVIPGAQVTIKNAAKGFTRNLVTNSAGAYVAASIPIGAYTITGEHPGFQRLVRSGINLQVGATLRVDLRMSVGEVTQEVSVSGNALHVQTESAAISNVITGNQIQNLNLNGRNFIALTLLVPGASPNNGLDLSHAHTGSDVSISFNGGRDMQNNIVIDGTPDSDEGGYHGQDTYPSLDSIAEFRVVTSNYGADMGKMGSAQIEVATKSGTNQFHGDAYEYVRNDAFDANPFFQNRQIAPPGGNAPKTPLKWNDFGYTIGGPFYIPKVYNTDKTKTFFFWSQEWHRYNEAQVINAPVPTRAMRTGDFSECDPASGNFNPVVASGCTLPSVNGISYDTVQQVPGFTQQAFINGAALLDGLVPLPNDGVNGYITSAVTRTHWRQELLRVDENLTTKTSMYFRGIYENLNSLDPTGNQGNDTYDTMQTPDFRSGENAVFHLVHTFTPSVINDFSVGAWSNWHHWTASVGPSNVARSIDRPSNFVMNHLFTVNNPNPWLPAVNLSGGVPFSFAMDQGPTPYENTSPTFDLRDDLTKVVGHHTLKFGFYLEKYSKNQDLNTGVDPQGSLTFNASGPITTGNSLADMFLGNIQQYTEAAVTRNGVPIGGFGRGYWRMTDFEPYAQDTWKFSPKLTLNIGLRYYYWTPQHDIQNPPVDANFVPALYNPAKQAQLDANGNIIPGTGFNYTEFGNGLVNCGRGGIPAGCTVLNKKNFAPRFGFAYDPRGNGTTVIRGGYGVYFGDTSESGAEGMGGNPPLVLSPSGYNIVGYDNIVPGALGTFGLFVAIPGRQTFPSMQQFSLGVQHMFASNSLLSVSYVGSLGRHLTTLYNLNQIPDGVTTLNAPALANTYAVDGLSNNPNPVQMCDAAGNCNVQQVLANGVAPNIFFVPYRGYGVLSMNPLSSVSNYNSLQVSFRHAFSHGLTIEGAYTWSHEIDDSSSDGGVSGVDDSNLSRWRATGDLNRAQMLVANYVYSLPFFANSTHALVRQALGGWRISGITTFYSGQPINFGCGVNGFSSGIGEGVQCNTVGPVKIKKSIFNDPQFGPTAQWFDPNTVTQPNASQLYANHEPGMFGYMGRNVLTGPGRNNWDIALLKDFKTPWFGSENGVLQFRLETFNTFNHTQWNSVSVGCSGVPNNDGTPAFGRPCGGSVYNLGNGEVNGASDPRIMQLALKFIF
ncbi:MAG: TonB-dependent receptor [Acidobacteriota bacterium]|nr:TonB-dependent receptor [Acidobacteriota bacterium]